MKQVRYGQRVWLVGDETAAALMDYAAALARADSAQHVTLPVLDINGMPEELDVLLGPATMMTVEPSPEEFDEPDLGDAVERIRAHTEALNATT